MDKFTTIMAEVKNDSFENIRELIMPINGMVSRKYDGLSEEDQKEFISAVVERVIKDKNKFDEQRGTFVWWVSRIMMNVYRDKYKKKLSKYKEIPMMTTLDGKEVNIIDLYYSVESAEEEYMKKELVHTVRQAIASLPENYQTVITLFYGYRLSYKEISEKTGFSENKVRNNLFRALSKLREDAHIIDLKDMYYRDNSYLPCI